MPEMRLIDAGAMLAEIDKIEMPPDVYAAIVASFEAAPTVTVRIAPPKKAAAADELPLAVYRDVLRLFSQMCGELPQPRKLTDALRALMRARIREADGEDESGEASARMWRELFGHVRRSSFLRGGNARGWRATLEWLCKPANFGKTMAGAYDDRGTADYAAGSFDTDAFFEAALARRA